MTDREVKIDLGAVQETLMIPLWSRAQEMSKDNPIVLDPLAGELIDRIDYDFSEIEQGPAGEHQGVWAIRAYNFDNIIKAFLASRDQATVVNIGAGLDTTFRRVDDGSVQWINIDLPDVADLRRELIPDSERERTIGKSILDFTWIDDITRWTDGRSILFTAAGVLCYFEAREVEILFRKLARSYPSSHVVFDSLSWLTKRIQNKQLLKKSGMDRSVLIKWHLKRASGLRKWGDSIRVVEEYPMLSRVPAKNDFSDEDMKKINFAGRLRLYNMMHVQL